MFTTGDTSPGWSWRAALFAGAMVGLLGGLLSLLPFGLAWEEMFGLDFLFSFRGRRAVPPAVAIVAIDRATARELELSHVPERWPRSIYARLLDVLREQGAAVVVFDMIFSMPGSPEDDAMFARASRRAGNVVLCEYLTREKYDLTDEQGNRKGTVEMERVIPPIPSLSASAVGLAPFPLPRRPVRVSQYWLFKTGAGDRPTLPVVAFQVYCRRLEGRFLDLLAGAGSPRTRSRLHGVGIKTGSRGVEDMVRDIKYLFEHDPSLAAIVQDRFNGTVPVRINARDRKLFAALLKMYQGRRSRYLNFYGPPGTIPTISSYRLLLAADKRGRELPDLQGKAVFIGVAGATWMEQKDGFPTVFSGKNGQDISGVELAATAFANLAEDVPLRPLSYPRHLLLVFCWGVLAGVISLFWPAICSAVVLCLLCLGYFAIILFLFKVHGFWYPLVVPVLIQVPVAYFSAILYKYFKVRQRESDIRKAFAYYLPDSVIDRLVKDLASLQTGRQRVYGTCLMTDAWFYTSFCEQMDPEELGSFMNRYFEKLFVPVRRHGGVVSDVVGDSMLAIWTTARPDLSLRRQACLAALEIASLKVRFSDGNGDSGILPTRIGLHSGYMVLRNIGAINHYEYTPIGDIVNTASRIESLNKYLDTRLLATGEVLEGLDGFLARSVGRFLLSGKSRAVEIYELLGPVEETDGRQKQLCTDFAAALQAYVERRWEVALPLFQRILNDIGPDGPSLLYAGLCEKYIRAPPDTQWDGVVRLDRK